MTIADDIELLDGGADAFPRMITAIESAQRFIHLEVYTLALDEVGGRFVVALKDAARRGVSIRVILDGWGSVEDGEQIVAMLRDAGVQATIYNPISRLLLGRLWRNHRKILVVDDRVAFLGGINIADEYLSTPERLGWADLAVSVRGAAAAWLGQKLRGERVKPLQSGLIRIRLSGLGGGAALRRRYLKAIARAKSRIYLAHAYFLPDRRLVKALRSAARRGVEVRLLLAGRTDVFLARAATTRLYRDLLESGVVIHEWHASVLHAKAAVIDGRRVLVGSFNLDPLSLTNLEALVEVDDFALGLVAEAWISGRIRSSPQITAAELRRGTLQAVIFDRLGLWAARLAHVLARILLPHRTVARHRSAALVRSKTAKLR